MSRVPQVPECPSVFQVPECLSAQVPKCLECPSVQVPFKCPSVWSAQVPFECLKCPSPQVPWVPECPSALWVPWVPQVLKCVSKCPSSLRVPECLEYLECLRCSSAPVPWESKCLIKSVSQSASQLVGVQCWFSKLISTLRAPIWREDLILRLRKLDLISNSSLIKLKSLK